MIIPPQIAMLLENDDELKAAVHFVLSLTKPWFEDNKLIFFPE